MSTSHEWEIEDLQFVKADSVSVGILDTWRDETGSGGVSEIAKVRRFRSPEDPEGLANIRLMVAAPKLLEALKEIAKGEGRYSRDPLTHADNTIDDMKAIAVSAIAKAEGH